MYSLLLILIILVCVLLGAIVLIQNPKGGGLTSNFSSSSQLMGVQKTGDFLEKGTWVLAILLMVFSLAFNVATKPSAAVDSATEAAAKKVGNGATTTQPSSGTVPLPTSTGAKKPK